MAANPFTWVECAKRDAANRMRDHIVQIIRDYAVCEWEDYHASVAQQAGLMQVNHHLTKAMLLDSIANDIFEQTWQEMMRGMGASGC